MLDIELILERKAKIDKDIKVLIGSLSDKTISLEHRWQTYERLCKASLITKNDPYGDGYIDTLHPTHEFVLFDDFCIDRRETLSFMDMLETIEQRVNDADKSWGNPAFKEIDLDSWKEAVLADGYASFTYDW